MKLSTKVNWFPWQLLLLPQASKFLHIALNIILLKLQQVVKLTTQSASGLKQNLSPCWCCCSSAWREDESIVHMYRWLLQCSHVISIHFLQVCSKCVLINQLCRLTYLWNLFSHMNKASWTVYIIILIQDHLSCLWLLINNNIIRHSLITIIIFYCWYQNCSSSN